MRTLAAMIILLASSGAAVGQIAASQVSATGFITNTPCRTKGANSLHIDCAKRKVSSGKAKYAFYDERTRRLYVLADQQAAEQYLGQHLQVTGALSFDARQNTDVLIISSVGPAPAPRTTR
jgi:hypothetical protein